MKIGAKIIAIFVVVLMIVGIVGIQSYMGIQQVIEADRWVIHTHQVRENLENVLSVLKDAETGQRGFILTGEDRYLEPYNTASRDISKYIESVAVLTKDNPEQQQSLQLLQKLSAEKLAELQETIKLRKEAGIDAALRIVLSDRGKKIMDDIRALTDQMESREGGLLESRNRVASETAHRSMLMIGFGVLLSLSIVGIAAVFVMRTMQLADRSLLEKDSKRSSLKIVVRYAFAVAMVILAMAIRSWLEGFGPMPPFIIFYPGVLLVASITGGGPGILFTILAVLEADYWYFPPMGQFAVNSPSDALALGIFGGSSLLLSILAERMKRAQRAEAVSVTREKELSLLNMGNLMALNLDHRILRWSEGNRRLYGFETQEALNHLTYELLHTHFYQPMEQIHGVLMDKNYWEGEVTRQTKDGNPLTIALLWALRRDDNGKPLEILEVSTNITQQKLAEESLQQQSEELAQQNEELSQQAEELAQQSEELLEQNEELQTQSEEIQALNEELSQREKMLQTLLDSARLPLGEQEVVEKICHAAQDIFGQPATGTVVCEQRDKELKILARAGFDGYDLPASWPVAGSFIEMVIQHDSTASLENTFLRPDLNILSCPGRPRFAAVLSSPLRVKNRPIGAISIYSGKTEQWTTEQFRLIEWLAAQCSHTLEAMRLADEIRHGQEQNEFLANIIEASSQAFGVGYPDGRLGLINNAFERLTGYSSEELQSIDWATTLTPPEWDEIERQRLDELHRTGLPVRYEKEYIRKDGTRVPIELLVHVVSDMLGKPLYYYSFITDITVRKRAENELRKSQSLLNEMGKIAKVGGWEFHMETLELQWTEEVYHIHEVELSYTPTVSEAINFYVPDSRPVIAQAVQRAIEFGEPFDLNLEIATAKGNHRWVQAIGNADRALKIVKGTFQDITDRKQVEEKIKILNDDLLARNEQLEFANKELESFIYSISHDLRGPLRHIAGFTDLLDKSITNRLEDKEKRYLTRIHTSAEKMGRLIDDLLNLSRISRQEIKRTQINLSEIATSTIAELREAYPDRRIEVDIKKGVIANVDRGLIEVVLSNLLGNAWKFTTQTEGARIEFGTIGQDGNIVYYVRDNGAGFAQEYAGKMFWPFHRLHSEEAFEGTGIGLAIVERIIHSHGGKVWAEGKEGKGATIYFSLN